MTHIQQRRDQSSIWTTTNPVLMDGEAGHESDTGKWKMGNGVDPWIVLPYKAGVNKVAGRTGDVVLTVADVAGAAPLASPVLTGYPTAPTRGVADSSTNLATTAFVKSQGFAPLSSPIFVGDPQAPTPSTTADNKSLATTEFVQNHVGSGTRLAPTSSGELVSYDTKVQAGWYVMSGGAPNAPIPIICYLEVRAYGTTYIEQIARNVNTGSTYARYMVNNVWGAWTTDTQGQWVSWTPTVFPSAGTITTVATSGRWTRHGNTAHVSLRVYITNAGTATGHLFTSLPVAVSASGRPALFTGREYQTLQVMCQGFSDTGQNYATFSTYSNATLLGAPRTIEMSATYEAGPV